ncbi:MAG: hypothetical protein AAF670_11220 [Planctomycetota bacterium]
MIVIYSDRSICTEAVLKRLHEPGDLFEFRLPKCPYSPEASELDVRVAFGRGARLSPHGKPAAVMVHRRHLSPSQAAMCAARAREVFDQQAKERQKRKPAGSVVENLPQQDTKARDAAGKAFGVSGRSVDHATKVLSNAVPEVVEAVDSPEGDNR